MCLLNVNRPNNCLCNNLKMIRVCVEIKPEVDLKQKFIKLHEKPIFYLILFSSFISAIFIYLLIYLFLQFI